jgi:hypothetical protein
MDIEMKVQILRACSSKKGSRCSSCPAFGHGKRNCIRNAMKDAADALSTLQAENEKLQAELDQMKRERDSAVDDMTVLMAGQCCDLCAVEHCNDKGKATMCTAFKWGGQNQGED